MNLIWLKGDPDLALKIGGGDMDGSGVLCPDFDPKLYPNYGMSNQCIHPSNHPTKMKERASACSSFSVLPEAWLYARNIACVDLA